MYLDLCDNSQNLIPIGDIDLTDPDSWIVSHLPGDPRDSRRKGVL